MIKTFEEWAGMSTPPTEGLRIHTDKAWDIASLYSGPLASETRDLAAHIDIALREAFNAGRSAGIEEAAAYCEDQACLIAGEITEPEFMGPVVQNVSNKYAAEIRALNKEGE